MTVVLLGERVKVSVPPSLSLRRRLVATGVVLPEGLALEVFIKRVKRKVCMKAGQTPGPWDPEFPAVAQGRE